MKLQDLPLHFQRRDRHGQVEKIVPQDHADMTAGRSLVQVSLRRLLVDVPGKILRKHRPTGNPQNEELRSHYHPIDIHHAGSRLIPGAAGAEKNVSLAQEKARWNFLQLHLCHLAQIQCAEFRYIANLNDRVRMSQCVSRLLSAP